MVSGAVLAVVVVLAVLALLVALHYALKWGKVSCPRRSLRHQLEQEDALEAGMAQTAQAPRSASAPRQNSRSKVVRC